MLLLLIFFKLLIIKHVTSARILGAVFTPSFSHQTTFWPIWKQLSLRGHQVIVLTTNPINNSTLTNLTEIDLSSSHDLMKTYEMGRRFMGAKTKQQTNNRLSSYINVLHKICDHQFSNPQVQNLIKNQSEHFDLLMVEVTYPSQMAFAERFKVPFIGLMSLDAPSRIHGALGNPINPGLYPDAVVPFRKNLTFYQRVVSSLVLWFLLFWGNNYFQPACDEVVRKHFGDGFPSLVDIERNMSMLFTNTNPLFNTIRPLGPSTVPIGGGLNFRELEPLPKEMKTYLDESVDGFIYFSLGSYVTSSNIEPQERSLIIETLGEIPYNVLLKFDSQDVSKLKLPDNLKVFNWFPQQTVLKHPNIKLFITQCGLQSMEEAVSNGVLMVGLPLAGDQLTNSYVLKNYEIGISLNFKSLTKKEFKDSILEVIKNPKYRKNMDEVSEIYNDADVAGIDKAIWWTEYVLRHKGAEHLRNPGADLPFYQYFLLDVALFLIVVVFLVIYLFVKFLRFVFFVFCKFTFSKNKVKSS